MTEDKDLKLLDSNILVYAYDRSEAKKHGSAKELVKECWLQNDAVLSVQNLVEFYSIITRKVEMPLAVDKAKQIVLDCIEGFEILKYDEKTVVEAINSQAIYGIPFWDALIVATMQQNSLDTIITENEKDFKKISWLKVINPFR
jgi:predicted nucleic acid-binding protein